ncbi:MAG: hypothetical protein QG602_943 [Verrucomicrobiota bacterium]|nr:hypothetical protein [Verrucomicrobiota bacterium]
MRSAERRLGVVWAQPNPTMPATPKLFGTLHNAAVSLSMPADCPAGSRLGFLLARLVDRLAPEGYEDAEGFHAQGAVVSGGRNPAAEPSCRGESI